MTVACNQKIFDNPAGFNGCGNHDREENMRGAWNWSFYPKGELTGINRRNSIRTLIQARLAGWILGFYGFYNL